MTSKTRVFGMLCAAGIASTAFAQVPAALDHVSADTPLIIGVKNLQEFTDDIHQWADGMAPPEFMGGIEMARMMISVPGLNSEGSAAVALTFDPNSPEPVPLMVIPVSDYATFVETMQGQPGDSVSAISMNGEELFTKRVGDGFAAVSDNFELVEAFDGSAGQARRHNNRLGKGGAAAAGDADMFLIVDLQSMRPMIEQGMEEMNQQMEMVKMMGGESVAGQIDAMTGAMNAVVEDGRTAFIGLGADGDGLWLDFAGQFAGNSEMSKIFADGGNSGELFKTLPAMDYIAAWSMDHSSEGMQSLMEGMMAMNQGGGLGLDLSALGSATGGAAVMGTTPGLFAGGLFANTVNFIRTSDTDGFIEEWETLLTQMNGQSQEGILMSTSIEENATEINGKPVYGWSMMMEADPNDPNAMAAGMAIQQMAMMFGGQAGVSGYAAAGNGGLYTTMSKNSALMEKALTGSGGSFADTESIAAVAAHLPDDRTMEGYLNIKGVLDMVGPMMAAFGAPAIGDLPEDMLPIAMSMTTGGGGMHARVFVPGTVIDFAGSMAEQFGGGGDWGGADEEPASRPRF